MKKRTFLTTLFMAISLVIFLTGCNSTGTPKESPFELSDIKTGNKSEMELYVIDSGYIVVKDMSVFHPGDTRKNIQLPMTSYLIVHPEGILMWDAGLPDGIAEKELGEQIYGGQATWFLPVSLKTQLEKIGIAPSEVNYLGLSHIHPDHIGNSGYFKEATLLINSREYESIAATIEYSNQFGLDTAELEGLKTFKSIRQTSGLVDLFGDSSVVLIPAPGHSPGHQVLYVDLPQTGPVVLTGDLYFSEEDRKNYVVPPTIEDKKALVKSFVLIDDLIALTGAKVWHNHDAGQREKVNLAPLYYQ